MVWRSSVVGLHLRGGPSYVPRLVTAIIINPVQGMAERSRTYVGNKSREIISPLIADLNATTSITRVIRIIRVVAPSYRSMKRLVLRSIFASRGESVGFGSRTGDFFTKASAAFRTTRFQAIRINNSGVTAIANAVPCTAATPNGER